jgi:hypothetical protein
MAKNLTFQHLHFNKKVNIVNSIYSKLTITIHSLLFKQLYFISSPFSFFCFLSPFFDDCSRNPFCFFFLPSQLSSLPPETPASTIAPLHYTTLETTPETPIVEHHCTTLQKRRRAPLHYTTLETLASTTHFLLCRRAPVDGVKMFHRCYNTQSMKPCKIK